MIKEVSHGILYQSTAEDEAVETYDGNLWWLLRDTEAF